MRDHLADRIRIGSALLARGCDEHAISLGVVLDSHFDLRQLTNRMLRVRDPWPKLEPLEQGTVSQPIRTWKN